MMHVKWKSCNQLSNTTSCHQYGKWTHTYHLLPGCFGNIYTRTENVVEPCHSPWETRCSSRYRGWWSSEPYFATAGWNHSAQLRMDIRWFAYRCCCWHNLPPTQQNDGHAEMVSLFNEWVAPAQSLISPVEFDHVERTGWSSFALI